MIPLFSDAMRLEVDRAGPGPAAGAFAAVLNEHWTIGPKVHGGVMVALCAKAARLGFLDGAPDPAGRPIDPVAISANFLSAPEPGPVRLLTQVRKRGRRIGTVDVELVAGERTCVQAAVTLGNLGQGEPLLVGTPAAAMTPEPPADVPPIGPGHPGAEINNLARGCDIHPAGEGTDPQAIFSIWVRPKTGPVDEYFALMCGDISVPVSYAVGRRGWAPTVQLTAYLRDVPADGWLRVLCGATRIGPDWFDEDHTVVDSAGRVVVQTRQLALLPGR